MSDYSTPSLLAELILSLTLLFIWLMQRQEKHALYWGLGQLSLIFLTLYWVHFQSIIIASEHLVALRLFSLLGVAGYWSGTRFFLGKPVLPVQLAFVLCILGVLTLAASWGNSVATVSIGLLIISGAFLLCGYEIQQVRAYRIVGWLLICRGVNNLAFIFAFEHPNLLHLTFLFGAFTKIASCFGLIYAILHELQHRYGSTLATLHDGLLIHDRQGLIRHANPALATMLGYGHPDELQGKNVCTLFPTATPALLANLFARLAQPQAQFPVISEYVLPCRNGNAIPIEASIAPYIERGQTYLMVQIRDISERKAHEVRLQELATIDEVSGLFNRNALNERLQDVIAARLAAGRECALLFIDLDHFKRVNDTLGHAIGDLLLKEAGQRLQAVTTEQDLVARFGGDEFVIVLADLAAETVQDRADRIAQTILAQFAEPFSIDQLSAVVTPSIGIAICPEHGKDANTLLKHADTAMYAAKHAGRNEFRLFDESMNAATEIAMQIDAELRHAIGNNELSLVFQPIVDAHDHRIKKVEALLRWHNPKLGQVSPDRFIPVAEESGLIVNLGNWVLCEACRQRGLWQSDPLADTVISINVSAWQLADQHFAQRVGECLQAAGLQTRQIELELTERVLIEEEGSTRATLLCLQNMGVGLSLDDFGTGYSSLNYLTRFHLDTLKIDRSFVQNIETNGRSLHLTQAIISMGGSLEIALVAEGVETAEQAELLRDMGCQYLQGYYFSKPLSATQLQEKYAAI